MTDEEFATVGIGDGVAYRSAAVVVRGKFMHWAWVSPDPALEPGWVVSCYQLESELTVPQPIGWTNIYPGGFGNFCETIEQLETLSSRARVGVLISWSDGSHTIEQVAS